MNRLMSTATVIIMLIATQAISRTMSKQFVITDLGALPGGISSAEALNNRGQIVGSNSSVASGEVHAILWEDGQIIDLGTLPGGTRSSAQAINDRGQIVGGSITASGGFNAVLWTKR